MGNKPFGGGTIEIVLKEGKTKFNQGDMIEGFVVVE
jgi:hypothetical protein